ncbi:MAG: choice-of-anchor L domain-containing protein [Flavobacteriales bacterium]
MSKIITSLFLFICLSSFVNAQLITSPGQTPQNLVQNILIGPGVTVSNILYNGSPMAISSFTANGTNLGINQGIVMTTGTVVNNGSGPQGPNNAASSGIDNNSPGSGLLSNNILGGTQTYNAATLEFDFIPYADTVRFKYVFGSEEYPEFAPPNNSTYNDVFGFFISGPGITGLQNIAQLPNAGGVVSINNVNAVTNAAYYNANGDGSTAPYNSSPNYIQYDGFTDVLEAVSAVQCGQSYHLILAIADVGDGSWDSGIFLEANSLTTKTPVDITYSLSQQVFSSPDVMAEGCVTATVNVTRQNNLNTALTIPITLTGSATSGIDYSGIPTNVVFSPGQSVFSFQIVAISDGFAEGLESIILNFNVSDPCGNITPIPLTIFIQDISPLTISLNDTVLPCPGQPVTLNPMVSGGVPPYTYLWSTGATTPTLTLSPQSSQTVYLEVFDNCSGQMVMDSAIITLPVFQPLSLQLSPDVVEVCPYIEHTFTSQIAGGNGNYTLVWQQNGQTLSTSSGLTVSPASTSTYTLTVSDGCGNSLSGSVTYTITSDPLVLTMSPIQKICIGDSAFISVSATGGYGNYYYLWPSTGETTPGIWVTPNATNSYQVLVSDECQTFTVSGFAQVQIVKPNADFTVLTSNPTENLPTSFYNLTQNGFGYVWDFGDGNTSYEVHPTHTFSPSGEYLITLIATDMNGCVDSISKPIFIQEEFYIYIPNSFIPDDNRINDAFSGSFIGVEWIKIEIFNRWGERLFYSEDLAFAWDGTFNGEKVPDGIYTWKLIYRRNKAQEQQMSGHITVIK